MDQSFALLHRYRKVLIKRNAGDVTSSYGEQSYLALNTEEYDDTLDDASLLRPPPTDGDLIS